MTDALQLALVGLAGAAIAGLPATIMALGSLRRVEATIMEAAKVTVSKLSEVDATVKVIDGHVNSAASRSAEEITGLRQELALMREIDAEKKEIAAQLARDAVVPGPVVVNGSVAVGHDTRAAESLKQIDTNTAETAKNTARTDHTVQELKDNQS